MAANFLFLSLLLDILGHSNNVWVHVLTYFAGSLSGNIKNHGGWDAYPCV